MQANSDSRDESASSQLDTLFEGKPLDKLARVEVADVATNINQLATRIRPYLAIKRVY